jgi:acetyltransferase-like isoleucine patch superfamily enzyme
VIGGWVFRELLQAGGRYAKRDPLFAVDDALSAGALLGFLLRRTVMAARGAVLAARTSRWVYPVFVGRGVVVTDAAYLRLSPGVTIGDYCRLDCVGRAGITLGPGTTLRRGVHIEVTSNLKKLAFGCKLGARVGVSEGSFIGAKGPVIVGDETDIGPGCRIIAENHSFDDMTLPIREQPLSRKGIAIGKNCWLGANVVILDGTSIGDGVVVAAGSVVTRGIPSDTVVAGVPAKPVRARGAVRTDRERY